METTEKLEGLKQNLAQLQRVAVAYSGGVDSTFLLWVARKVLGDGAVAVTAQLQSFPEHELEETKHFCRERGIRQIICEIDELKLEKFRENPPDRCYYCKKHIFSEISRVLREQGDYVLVEGSNVDDASDYRPGARAIRELGVKSPLQDAGLTKNEIRQLSKQMELPTWDKPSCACLASRFAYGEMITTEKLSALETAENFLHELGFHQLRVRVHGSLARIEVLPQELPRLFEDTNRTRITQRLQELGFSYVTADLLGFRSGSMNECLRIEDTE